MSLARPTSKLPAKSAPAPAPHKDPLPWWAGAILVAFVAAVRLLLAERSEWSWWRIHVGAYGGRPGISQTGLVVGFAAAALIWRTPFITRRFKGRLYGRGRTGCTIVAVGGLSVALAGFWHASGWWHLTLPALAVWVTTTIGGGRDAKHLRERFRMAHAVVATSDSDTDRSRAVHEAQKGLALFRTKVQDKYPTATVTQPTETPSGGLQLQIHGAGPGADKLFAWMAGEAFGYPQNDILVTDLSYEGRTGTYKVVIGAPEVGPDRPWDMDPPEIPPRDEWPDLCYPLGWTIDGILWASLRIHWMFAGITDSGKSNSLNVKIAAAYQMGFQLVLIDPKETELWPWRNHAYAYADDAKSIRATLLEVERVRELRKGIRRTANVKKWNATLGPFILVVIDEIAEAIKIAPEVALTIETLARLARSEGIILVIADQHPSDKSFPTIIKRNMPNVVCHKVSDGGAGRVALGESITGKGFDPSDPTIPAGGAVAKVASGTTWVQVFMEGEMPPTRGIGRVEPEAPSSPSSPASTTPPVQDEYPELDTGHWTVDTPEMDTPKPKRYKHDDAIENALTGLPRSARDIADEVGCSPTTATQALARIAARGRAKAVGDGWVCPYLHELAT